MSETVKLIIEIPKRDYEEIKKVGVFTFPHLSKAIREATPLDDVKLKIEQDMSLDMFDDYGNETAIHKELWEILDNIGKGDEE